MKKRFPLLLIGGLFLQVAHAQTDWREITTVEDACAAWPEEMKHIFQNLDLDYPGLEKVKSTYNKGDLPGACGLLLQYYADSEAARMPGKELPAASSKTTPEADAALNDTYTFQTVTGHVPRKTDGHLDWTCKGPENDIEWAWALNRHYPVRSLLTAYDETGNPDYVRYIDSFIKDWIIQSRPYPAKKSSTEMWRGLEVHHRVKMWVPVFYEFIHTDYISPATRLLILSTLPDHAHYNRHFHSQGNWLTMEMSGLATAATAWPEFKQVPEWIEYSIGAMTKSLEEQVYPDGVQTELASHYHRVALDNFSLFEELCRKAQNPLPEEFTTTLEQMWNYLALTLRPSGFGLLNNDSDLDYNRDRILDAAEQYNRPDWEHIASNGQSGTPPKNGPSFAFPWAGQLISRSGYDADAHWSFFDIGPWGVGHQHNDKLHLSVSAFGRDLLIDGGRFAYRGAVAKKFRKYALGSQSHNTILIDGNGQAPGQRKAGTPLSKDQYKITADHDYACGSFEQFNVQGTCRHTRTLFYKRGEFWVVVDQIETDRPRDIEALWHFHPDCTVNEENNTVLTTNERENLAIIPLGEQNWDVNLIKGQETPEIQGWYSRVYNTYEPNTTAVYSARIESGARFIWVLFPSEKPNPNVRAEIISETKTKLRIRVTDPTGARRLATVPLHN